jgi:molecular chaperone IbpA
MKGEKMTKITALDLNPFYRNSIGVDRLFDRILNQIDSTANTNYPPYNLVETGENTYQLQLAVAGFTQGEIEVNVKDGDVLESGEKATEILPEGHKYHHQGISARRFIRSWTLGNYVEVESAVVQDGILTIQLERLVPEAMKPKTIAITYKS